MFSRIWKNLRVLKSWPGIDQEYSESWRRSVSTGSTIKSAFQDSKLRQYSSRYMAVFEVFHKIGDLIATWTSEGKMIKLNRINSWGLIGGSISKFIILKFQNKCLHNYPLWLKFNVPRYPRLNMFWHIGVWKCVWENFQQEMYISKSSKPAL